MAFAFEVFRGVLFLHLTLLSTPSGLHVSSFLVRLCF